MNDSERAAIAWLGGPDTGMSSRTLVNFLLGSPQTDPRYPWDPDDLGRCIRALDLIPSFRERLDEARILGPVWDGYIAHWARLEELFRVEEPTGLAPLCYAAMKYVQRCVAESLPVTSQHLEDVIAAAAAEEAAKPPRKPTRTVPFIIPKADVEFLTGKSIDTVAKTMKALTQEYSTPCIRCKKKRMPMMFGRFGPTPNRDMCDPCSRLPA